jgi:TonB family protein
VRRLLGILAAFSLFLGLAVPARSQGEESPRFEPIQVVSAEAPPGYPATSIAEGTVILEVTVDESGKIGAVKVIHGIASLTEDAEQTVRNWKFKPATLDGKPVTSTLMAAFSYARPAVRTK